MHLAWVTQVYLWPLLNLHTQVAQLPGLLHHIFMLSTIPINSSYSSIGILKLCELWELPASHHLALNLTSSLLCSYCYGPPAKADSQQCTLIYHVTQWLLACTSKQLCACPSQMLFIHVLITCTGSLHTCKAKISAVSTPPLHKQLYCFSWEFGGDSRGSNLGFQYISTLSNIFQGYLSLHIVYLLTIWRLATDPLCKHTTRKHSLSHWACRHRLRMGPEGEQICWRRKGVCTISCLELLHLWGMKTSA